MVIKRNKLFENQYIMFSKYKFKTATDDMLLECLIFNYFKEEVKDVNVMYVTKKYIKNAFIHRKDKKTVEIYESYCTFKKDLSKF